jgi:ribosome-binding factor A
MREFQRTDRIGSELRRELAQLLRDEVKDPRLGMVTVQKVKVSRDLGHARVYFTCLGSKADAQARQELLNGALAGFLRRELGRHMRLRTIPQLHFVYDESIERGERLSSLIEDAVASDQLSSD